MSVHLGASETPRTTSAPTVERKKLSTCVCKCGTFGKSSNEMANCSRNSRYGALDKFSTLYATIAEFGMYAIFPALLMSLVYK